VAGTGGHGIRHQRHGRVGRITLDRPPLNVLDIGAFEGIDAAIDALAGAEIVVIGSAIDRAFSAGADVADHLPERAPGMLAAFHKVARRLWGGEFVSIASVPGLALGGGMELALCCDLVVASAGATFGQPEIKVGSFPPIAAALLPERIGPVRAADLILTGRSVTAAEAHAMGIVSRLAGSEGLETATGNLVEDLLSNSGAVTRCALRALRAKRESEWSKALEMNEEIYIGGLLPLADAREGVEAFLEKRDPRWKQESGEP